MCDVLCFMHYVLPIQRQIDRYRFKQQQTKPMSRLSADQPRAQQSQQQRQPRVGPYIRTNAYTHPPSFQQIVTLLIVITQIALHSVFIVNPIISIYHVVLFIMLGFHYAFLLMVIIDYIYLTIFDPVDLIIIEPQTVVKHPNTVIKDCSICRSKVHITSHHCMRCNRCSEQFDHHCKYLNNCIGGRNYESFIRLLFVYIMWCINIIGQGIWVIIVNFKNANISPIQGNQWGVLALLILTGLAVIAVGGLLIFHIYITCYWHTTTFDHILGVEPQTPTNRQRHDTEIEVPPSEDYLKRMS